jgi:hypothetical protein
MQCETADRKRGFGDWAVLAVLGALVLFYAGVLGMILKPRYDEDFRRTFVTGEFGVYPPSEVFKGRNGLDYAPGTRVDLTRPKPRLYLNRFDWLWQGDPGPRLKKLSGRIFVHVEDALRRPDRPHRLSIAAVCAYPAGIAGRFRVSVNGSDVGGFTCADHPEPFVFSADLPAGAIGVLEYDEIRLTREPEGLSDRLATAFGMRIPGFQMPWFAIETL